LLAGLAKPARDSASHAPALPAQSEIEETLERIKSHKGVEGVLVVNSEGVPIRPSKGMDDEKTQKYAANISQLAAKARSVVRDLDPQNDLTFLRIRTKNHEIMVAPDKDYLLIVVQNPSAGADK
jgi:dynein light chain roadblock-type